MVLSRPGGDGDAEVNLINQRQIFVAFGVLNLVDPDGIDPTGTLRCSSP